MKRPLTHDAKRRAGCRCDMFLAAQTRETFGGKILLICPHPLMRGTDPETVIGLLQSIFSYCGWLKIFHLEQLIGLKIPYKWGPSYSRGTAYIVSVITCIVRPRPEPSSLFLFPFPRSWISLQKWIKLHPAKSRTFLLPRSRWLQLRRKPPFSLALSNTSTTWRRHGALSSPQGRTGRMNTTLIPVDGRGRAGNRRLENGMPYMYLFPYYPGCVC